MSVNKHIIDVQTKGAKKSEKQIKGVGGALGNMAKSAALAAGAYFGGRMLLNGIKSSIDLFGKQELAEKKLEAALGRTSPALLKQARALQQVSMFGDEVIIEAQALIGSFVKEEDAIKAATKATLDLAAAKGMELTVAADLVSKTLGSSTNALSRYGIEVTGAVGSTERLESLTGNLAAVFGGQATAQSETFAGSMAQLSNAFGDMQERIGEKLAPALGNLANKFKDIITINPSQEAIKEKEGFESLISVLTDVNTSTNSRNIAINKLKKSYGPYLGDLDIEKASTEDLIKLKTDVISVMAEEIKQKQFAEELRNTEIKIQKSQKNEFELEMKIKKQLLKHEQDKFGIVNKNNRETEAILDGHKAKTLALKEERDAILQGQKAYEEWLKTQQKVVEVKEEVNVIDNNKPPILDPLEPLVDFEESKPFWMLPIPEDVIESQSMYNHHLLQGLQATKEKAEQDEKFIELYPEQAKQLGLVSKKEKEDAKSKKSKADMMKALAKDNKAIAISEALQATYGSARDQFKQFSKAFPAPLGQILGVAASAAAIAGGMKDVERIRAAATGADYTTSGPELLLVGDNPSGEERVQVTPLNGDPGPNAPQGSGITLNISGNVMSEEFTETMIVPQIKEALRLGGDLGV